MTAPILTASAAPTPNSDHREHTLKLNKLHKRLRRHAGQAIAE